MVRKFDKLWLIAICAVYRWTSRQADALCRREKQRQFRRVMAWQNQHLN